MADDINAKALRVSLSMTQSAFASALGVALRTVQDWEAGKARTPKMVALAVAGMFAPKLFDLDREEMRQATQADIDTLMMRCAEAVTLRNDLMMALRLPLNAHDQVAKLAKLGGLYGASSGAAGHA